MANKPKSKLRIRFNAEPHHILEADGKTIPGGGEEMIDADIALTLAHSSWANVEIVDPSAPRWPSTHAALDAVANELGVTWPEADEGAQLSIPEKQAVLDAANPAQQPANADAVTGESETEERE